MRRRTFDILASTAGLILAVVLGVAGGLLLWAHNYVHDEVHTELAAQRIFFPPEGSPAIAAPEFAAMHQYAGQQLTTGPQAHVYANHFIANHLNTIGGGKTYAELSTQSLANPSDTKLAATVETMFKGETLRGLLLNAYAFWTIGTIAGYGALAAFIGAGLLLILSIVGIVHSARVPRSEEILTPHSEASDGSQPIPASVPTGA
jgi:hypothetical protein